MVFIANDMLMSAPPMCHKHSNLRPKMSYRRSTDILLLARLELQSTKRQCELVKSLLAVPLRKMRSCTR